MILPRQVRKRDGRLVPFDRTKLADAIHRACLTVGGDDRFLAEELSGVVLARLERKGPAVVSATDLREVVEVVLLETGHAEAAKAFSVHREQRTRARAGREVGHLPLVGGGAGGESRPWSKAVLVDLLVAEDRLERGEAEEVARAVEARLLRPGLPRVSDETLAALVRAELFDRGHDTRMGRTQEVALPRSRVRSVLAEGVRDQRASSPAEATHALGEALVAEHLLSDVLPRGAAEAHRLGDLHLYDVGAPLALTAITLPAERVLSRHLWGEGATRAHGARRVTAALRRAVQVGAPFAARTLALEDVNVLLAPFVSHLGDDELAEECRELLLSPELAQFPGRGGLLALELGLSAEIPARLLTRTVPPPAPPGMTYGDAADAALRVARQLLREQLALKRHGRNAGPGLTLLVPSGRPRDAALRALVREALSTAAEVGEPVLVFERPERASRGCRWLRLEESESPDPLRFGSGDVSVATAAAINTVACAFRAKGDVTAFLADLDRLVRQALEAAAARRALVAGPASEPGGALWPLSRGEHPLVDLEGAWHLVEPVGVVQAVAVLDPDGAPEDRSALRQRLLEHLHRVAQERGQALGLPVALAESPVGEAAQRFAGLDAERDPQVGAWWPEGETPTYRTPPPPGPSLRREPAWARRLRGGAWATRVRHRVDPERRPHVDDLLASMEAAERDQAVVEYAVDPWPRRLLRGPERGE